MQQREITISRNLSSLALQSILYEISLTPKPGLVDKFSNGAHSDMNYNTFINSTAAISGYFNDLVKAGFAFAETDMTKALPVIRNIGLRMEKSMFDKHKPGQYAEGNNFPDGIVPLQCWIFICT